MLTCRWAAFIWACRTHRRSDSAPGPTFGPITWQAAYTRPSGRSPGRRHTPDLRADHLAGGIHRPIFVKMIEHRLHRTLTLLDRVVLRIIAILLTEGSGIKPASNPRRFSAELRCVPNEGVDTSTGGGAVAAMMTILEELELELGRERRAASREFRRARRLPVTKPLKLSPDRQEQLQRLAATGEPGRPPAVASLCRGGHLGAAAHPGRCGTPRR